MQYVKIRVWCEYDHLIGEWTTGIWEKYPFFCQTCDDQSGDGDVRQGKYPWYLTTEIVQQ